MFMCVLHADAKIRERQRDRSRFVQDELMIQYEQDTEYMQEQEETERDDDGQMN